MAIVLADRVQETSTTTGTGTLNLAGAKTGYQTFVAGAATASVVPYCIVGQAGGGAAGEWETGYGTVTDASPDTLSRTTVVDSSNSGSLVNFSAGTKDVFLTAHTGMVGFQGALVYMTADEATAAGTPETLNFGAETYDDGGWHDNSTNPSRLTVPAGVGIVRLSFGCVWQSMNNTYFRAYTLKNGASFQGQGGFYHYSYMGENGVIPSIHVTTSAIKVASGDYFEVNVLAGTAGTIEADQTWFSIEKVA